MLFGGDAENAAYFAYTPRNPHGESYGGNADAEAEKPVRALVERTRLRGVRKMRLELHIHAGPRTIDF